MNWLLKKPIAHRGLHNIKESIPENSLPAFEKAIQKDFPVELDVRILKDDTVVVFHDNSLDRLTGLNKLIRDIPFSGLKYIYLLNTKEKIPSLDEALTLIDGKVPVLIDIKNEGKTAHLEQELLKILKNYKGEFAVQSFNPLSLLWFEKNAPGILHGQLFSDSGYLKIGIFKKMILSYFFNRKVRPQFISYDITALPNRKVSKLRTKGIPVLSWTITNNKDLIKAKKYSDNYIFEFINSDDSVSY